MDLDERLDLYLEDVDFRFAGSEQLLFEHMSVRIRSDCITALLGKSGTGKTSMLHMFAGYLLPTRGRGYYGGQLIAGPSADRVPIFHEDALWPWMTVYQNVALSAILRGGRHVARKYKQEVEVALQAVGLESTTAARMPRELSAGMKKRVELARALFADPEVILADEPFSSLDQITRGEIHRLILDLQTRRPRTVVFSTHDVDEALYLATMIIVLRQERATVVSGMFSNSYACKPNARTDDPAGYQEIRQSILGALDGKVG